MPGPNVGYATLSIIPSAKGALGNLQSELGGPLDAAGAAAGDSSSKSFGSKFKSGLVTAAKVGAVAFGGAAALAFKFGKDAVGAASELNESINAVNVVFGDAAEGVLAIGANSAKSLGLSKNEFNGLAVKFSSFASTVAGPGGDVAKTLSDMSTRAADFASVMNLDVSESAAIFQSALAGETEPIRKYGIDLSAATVETFAYAHGIGVAGEELTAAQKTQATYALLMESTNKTAGDFVNTSDSLANSQRIAKASFEDSKAAIGAGLLPVMAAIMPVVQKVAEWFGDKLPKAVAWLKDAVGFFGDGLRGLGTNEGSGVLKFLMQLGAAFRTAAQWVMQAWPTIKSIVTGVFSAIATAVSAFVGTVWPMITGALSWLMDNKEFLIGAAVTIGAVLLGMFVSWAASAVVAAIATAAAFLPFIAAVAIVAAIAGAIIYAYNHFAIFRDIITVVKDIIMNNVVPAFQAIASFIVDYIVPAFQAIWNFISTYIIPIISTLVETYIKVLIFQFNVIKFVITEVVIPALKAIWNFIQDKVVPVFVSIITTVITVGTRVGEIIGNIVGYVTGIPGRIGATISTLWDGLKNGIETARQWVSDKIDAVVGFATGLPGRMAGIFSGMWDGIKEAFRSAINFIIRGWNSLRFGIPEFDTHLPGVGKIGGGSVGTPHINELHQGGLVPGRGDVSAVLKGGEMVLTAAQQAQLFALANGGGAGGPSITLNNNRRDIGIGDLNQLLAMARLAS